MAKVHVAQSPGHLFSIDSIMSEARIKKIRNMESKGSTSPELIGQTCELKMHLSMSMGHIYRLEEQICKLTLMFSHFLNLFVSTKHQVFPLK